jgi:hypothetical protein
MATVERFDLVIKPELKCFIPGEVWFQTTLLVNVKIEVKEKIVLMAVVWSYQSSNTNYNRKAFHKKSK